MKVLKIWGADIYRDGGSYGFCFDSDDGHWYEFFLQTKAFEKSNDSHYPPVIYLEGCNGNKVVKKLNWAEANEFIAPLKYENTRFEELVNIVKNEGKRT